MKIIVLELHKYDIMSLTLLHSERPKLYGVVAVLSAKGLSMCITTLNFHDV